MGKNWPTGIVTGYYRCFLEVMIVEKGKNVGNDKNMVLTKVAIS